MQTRRFAIDSAQKTKTEEVTMLRRLQERILQTACFELGGLVLSLPVFAALTQAGESDALITLVAVSIAVMCWAGFHNFLFDWVEFRVTGRVASDRPNSMRLIHAISHEASAIVVSLPILIWLSGLSWQEALLADIGLTLFYAVYAFIFYRIYDAVRPVQAVQLQGI